MGKMMRVALSMAVGAVLLGAVALAAQAQSDEPNLYDSVLASEQAPDFAVAWMDLLWERVFADGVSAPAAARLYGYAGVTLYEAILPGMPDNNSLTGQVNEFPLLTYPDERYALDWVTVGSVSVATVLDGLFEDSDESQRAFAALLETQLEERMDAVGAQMVERSQAYAETVGAEILDWARADGAAEAHEEARTYEAPTGDASFWTPTADGMTAVEPYWGRVRPFALYYTDQCALDMRMEYSEDSESTFYKQALEVFETSRTLTDEQKLIAEFWVDTPGLSGTPAGHWVQIANGLTEQLDLSLQKSAEMYALTGIAVADAFIGCWSLKYQVNLLRPETYIEQHINRRWNPYIATPGFPEYPSGHSVVSAAAAEVLAGMFGTVAFTSGNVTLSGEYVERSFTSFEAAAQEAAISRLYGGIHFRAAIERGNRMGRCIGQHVLDNVLLRSLPQGE